MSCSNGENYMREQYEQIVKLVNGTNTTEKIAPLVGNILNAYGADRLMAELKMEPEEAESSGMSVLLGINQEDKICIVVSKRDPFIWKTVYPQPTNISIEDSVLSHLDVRLEYAEVAIPVEHAIYMKMTTIKNRDGEEGGAVYMSRPIDEEEE